MYEFADFNDFQKFKTQASDSDRVDFKGKLSSSTSTSQRSGCKLAVSILGSVYCICVLQTSVSKSSFLANLCNSSVEMKADEQEF